MTRDQVHSLHPLFSRNTILTPAPSRPPSLGKQHNDKRTRQQSADVQSSRGTNNKTADSSFSCPSPTSVAHEQHISENTPPETPIGFVAIPAKSKYRLSESRKRCMYEKSITSIPESTEAIAADFIFDYIDQTVGHVRSDNKAKVKIVQNSSDEGFNASLHFHLTISDASKPVLTISQSSIDAALISKKSDTEYPLYVKIENSGTQTSPPHTSVPEDDSADNLSPMPRVMHLNYQHEFVASSYNERDSVDSAVPPISPFDTQYAQSDFMQLEGFQKEPMRTSTVSLQESAGLSLAAFNKMCDEIDHEIEDFKQTEKQKRRQAAVGSFIGVEQSGGRLLASDESDRAAFITLAKEIKAAAACSSSDYAFECDKTEDLKSSLIRSTISDFNICHNTFQDCLLRPRFSGKLRPHETEETKAILAETLLIFHDVLKAAGELRNIPGTSKTKSRSKFLDFTKRISSAFGSFLKRVKTIHKKKSNPVLETGSIVSTSEMSPPDQLLRSLYPLSNPESFKSKPCCLKFHQVYESCSLRFSLLKQLLVRTPMSVAKLIHGSSKTVDSKFFKYLSPEERVWVKNILNVCSDLELIELFFDVVVVGFDFNFLLQKYAILLQ